MRLYMDRLVVHKGESFTLKHNLEGFVVGKNVGKTAFKVTLADDIYSTPENLRRLSWLEYSGPTFNHTTVISCDDSAHPTFYHGVTVVTYSEFVPGQGHYIINDQGTFIFANADDYVISKTVNSRLTYYYYTASGQTYNKTEYTNSILVTFSSDDTYLPEHKYYYSVDICAGTTVHDEIVNICNSLGISTAGYSDATLAEKIKNAIGVEYNANNYYFNYNVLSHICGYEFLIETGLGKVGK